MAVQYSEAVRNAKLDALETVVGPSPTLEIRTGPQPATAASPDSGIVLATLALPADWMLPASGGVKEKSGTWEDLAADATGQAGHYRLKAGATCHEQGSVAQSGADLNVDNINFATDQKFSITSWTKTAGNA